MGYFFIGQTLLVSVTREEISKTVTGLWVRRGFKSLPLRSARPDRASLSGIPA